MFTVTFLAMCLKLIFPACPPSRTFPTFPFMSLAPWQSLKNFTYSKSHSYFSLCCARGPKYQRISVVDFSFKISQPQLHATPSSNTSSQHHLGIIVTPVSWLCVIKPSCTTNKLIFLRHYFCYVIMTATASLLRPNSPTW
jgi:hypothetical protein